MRFKDKINDWSYMIFLIFCFLTFTLSLQILMLPENTCDQSNIQLINRLSNDINNSALNQPSSSVVIVVEEDVDCGPETGGWNGKSCVPYCRKTYDLGSKTGKVQVIFEAFNIPDRFIVYYNDKPVLDSGFLGDFRRDDGTDLLGELNTVGNDNRREFTALLRGKKDPLTEKTYPFQAASHKSDGFPIIKYSEYGNGFKMSFDKYSPSISTVAVRAFAPFLETQWDMIMGCPGEIIQTPPGGFIPN